MNLTWKLSRSARRDLQEVSDFWMSEVGEQIASRVLGGVLETIITLSMQPKAGVEAGQFGAGVRKFPAGKYMVYYRPHPKGIDILHVFHGARDQAKAWKVSSAKSKRKGNILKPPQSDSTPPRTSSPRP